MRVHGALAAALLLAGAAARAQPYDPAFRFRTLETPRFRIHYHQGEEPLAQEVARVAEEADAVLSPIFGWHPRRTEIVLSDDTDDANGSSTPLPYDTVRLYAVPPTSLSELNDYRDWVRELVFHEYVHILHLDRIGGFPSVTNRVFGKLWAPNGFVPGWMVEGLAVLHESEGRPGAGRNASAIHDMYARALALEPPGFPRLDQASSDFLGWPSGDVAYLLGGRFMAFLQDRHGEAAIRAYVEKQGAQVWPYAPSMVGKGFFGGNTFAQLWAAYADRERAHAQAVRAAVRTRPVTDTKRLTRAGGRAERPRWSPDGTFVAYWRRDLDRRPGLFRVAPDGRDLGRAVTIDQNGTFAMRSPREALVAIGDVYREYRVYDDLYRVDVASGRTVRLTRGERATDPDVLPGGNAVVYVWRAGAGRLALARRAIGADGRLGAREVLLEREGAQIFMPRLSPDGKRIAFELHEGGRRDIALLEDGRVTRVTDDDALDLGPAWTPDGKRLLFASDRGGVFNLYAWNAETGAIRQVTNVETGAFAPDVSPDGGTIAFLSYSRAGYDLSTVPFEPERWLEPVEGATQSPTATTAATTTTEADNTTATTTTTATETTTTGPTASAAPPNLSPSLPSHPYRALDTVGPTFWLPVLSSDSAGTVLGAMTGGTDVLLRHAWLAQGWWSTHGKEPGYSGAYAGAWSWPQLDLSSTRTITTSPDPAGRLLSAWNYADAGATFTFTRLARQLAFRIGWSGTRYDTLPGEGEVLPPPFDFRDGFLSDVSLTATYTDARRFVYSISPEEGRAASLTLRFAGRELGSDYGLARARGAIAQYVRIPWTAHAVLALRGSAGIARGTLGGAAPYSLGGISQASALSLLLGDVTSPTALRGYESGQFEGTGYVLGNAELRFPLLSPTRGRTTWPILLRRLHGALFLDVGEAFDAPHQLAIAGHGLDARSLRAGVGGELRLEIVLGYYVRTDLRAGVARGLGAPFGAGRTADPGLAPLTWYVILGPSF